MNSGLTKRLESVQYSAALAVAGGWKGTSYDKLLDELGWEYLYHRRWFKRLSHFYSIVNGSSPEYLKAELPQPEVYNYNLRECLNDLMFEHRDLVRHFSHIEFESGTSFMFQFEH